jgi:hypothetical protein
MGSSGRFQALRLLSGSFSKKLSVAISTPSSYIFAQKKELIDEFADANSEVTGMVQALHKARISQPDAPDAETVRIINKLHKRTRDPA